MKYRLEYCQEPVRVYVCMLVKRQSKNSRDRDNLETENTLAPTIVGNKLIPTSWEPMGVGETPSLFPGKQSPFSSSVSLSLSLLCMCLSVFLSHAPMFRLGGVEEEGNLEVTHCNIIAMAMKSEPGVEGAKGRKRTGISIGSAETEMAVTVSNMSKKKMGTFHECWTYRRGCLFFPLFLLCFVLLTISPFLFLTRSFFFFFFLLVRSAYLCPPLSVRLHSSPRLLSSSFLFRWPVARSPLVSEERVFHWRVTLSHVTCVFGHAEVEC